MMSASIDSKVRLLRGVMPEPVAEPRQSALISTFQAKFDRLRRLFSEELGCRHDELVFDDINDVSCAHCGKDFTG
jgi:hypothetical protein